MPAMIALSTIDLRAADGLARFERRAETVLGKWHSAPARTRVTGQGGALVARNARAAMYGARDADAPLKKS